MEIKQDRKPRQLKSCLPAETVAMVKLCSRLTTLEKSWQSLFIGRNEVLGRQTAVSKCVVEEDGIAVKIAVADSSFITSVKFKEKIFKTAIEQFVGAKVKKIEFVWGVIKHVSSAKEASRAYERYAPVIVTDEQIEKETHELIQYTNDQTLAMVIGKTKAMAEKKAKRRQ